MPVVHADCRLFTGYKPCVHGGACEGCVHHDPVSAEILIINLGALGDVLRTTAQVEAIHRAWPGCRLTWVTSPRAMPLLASHPRIHRVMAFDLAGVTELRARRFDVVLCVDKDRAAGGLARSLQATEKRGFGIDERGAIVPFNAEAQTLYDLGLDDEAKFRGNQRSEPVLLGEALGLPYAGEPYVLHLSPAELAGRGPRRRVGFNTGCSPLYPYKKLPLDAQAAAIEALSLDEPVLLLGGPEDTERNEALAARLGPRVELTPTRSGLRHGAVEVSRCDVVVTGDSLGMHLAIALGVHVVAWFGPTCPQEIELFGRGVKLLGEVGCAPCWKRTCDETPKCFDRVPPALIAEATHDALSSRARGEELDGVRGGGWWRPVV